MFDFFSKKPFLFCGSLRFLSAGIPNTILICLNFTEGGQIDWITQINRLGRIFLFGFTEMKYSFSQINHQPKEMEY